MEITVTTLKHCSMVKIGGRLDGNTAPDLEKALRALMDEDHFRLVLDMEAVEYFGSAAIRVLVMAFKECRRYNRGDVRLVHVPDRVRHVLDLAGILPLVQVFDDPVLAVGSF
jgi:anti-anti-sigma factor